MSNYKGIDIYKYGNKWEFIIGKDRFTQINSESDKKMLMIAKATIDNEKNS